MFAHPKNHNHIPLVTISILLAILFIVSALLMRPARGGERIACQLEPISAGDWHYRTKVGSRPERCYYLGERMKPRSELYWSEAPSIPPMSTVAPEPDFILRWRGHPEGWDHKE